MVVDLPGDFDSFDAFDFLESFALFRNVEVLHNFDLLGDIDILDHCRQTNPRFEEVFQKVGAARCSVRIDFFEAWD